MSVFIDVEDAQWNNFAALHEMIEHAVATTLPIDRQGYDVNILLTNDAEMHALNLEWRGMDKPTNVLSFAIDPDAPQQPDEAPMLGDLALAYETIAAEAIAQNKNFKDHTTHLIVHGTLHLLGYDHETDSDAAVMEAHEIALLKKLQIADPYTL